MKEYIAMVVSVNDPDGHNRAQVRVSEMFPESRIPDDVLPWATYKLPVGAGFNEGSFVPAKPGHYVWVDFPFIDSKGTEDTRRPRITGSVQLCPDGLPNMPHDSFGGVKSRDGLHKYPKVDDGQGEMVVDPDYEATKDSVVGRAPALTLEGWSFRLQNGAWTCEHLKTGSRFEFSENGFFDLFTTQNGFVRATKKLTIKAGELILKATKLIKFEFP
ncbi:MAG: hypothetical protein GY866_40640, partial [Proteobacteria bacterium]|nr:hypothetical protein [Pseudomonadota bacterium]